MKSGKPEKYSERGYLVVWLFYALDFIVTIIALYMQWWVASKTFEVAMLNYQLASVSASGYSTVIPFTVEFTALSLVIGSLQAAFAIVATSQAKKKRMNNSFQYIEEYVDKWLNTPETAPFAAQIFETFLQTNQNN